MRCDSIQETLHVFISFIGVSFAKKRVSASTIFFYIVTLLLIFGIVYWAALIFLAHFLPGVLIFLLIKWLVLVIRNDRELSGGVHLWP